MPNQVRKQVRNESFFLAVLAAAAIAGYLMYRAATDKPPYIGQNAPQPGNRPELRALQGLPPLPGRGADTAQESRP